MVKILNLKALLLTLIVFTIGVSSTFVGNAFAEDPNGLYSHSHITASWDHSFVCGDHKCAPGEMPQHPKPVEPIRAH
jgi:hypothetical protein